MHEKRESIAGKIRKYFTLVEEEPYEHTYEDLTDERDYDDDFDEVRTVRKITRYPDLDRARKTASIHSVPQPPQVRVHIVEPRNFNDCQQIADKYKENIPVIINLQLSDADLSKRLIDFASGLTYALDGGMQKVADRVFLLTPNNVDVSAEERRRLLEKGFFNQF
ncbi:MAG: cell division protein SepF [Actinomycetota bacterium]|jgi:cell division inhibitor SepF|nr:cell division protein SepF [Actinomycetota bacterium]